MSTDLKLNALLSLPRGFSEELKVGQMYEIKKEGARVMPLGVPMEVSTSDHEYLGKVIVKELRMTAESTWISFEVVKIFSLKEARVFTKNFIGKK